MKKPLTLRGIAIPIITLLLCLNFIFPFTASSQVNTGGSATTANHQKQIVGYITNWDAWKSSAHGVPSAGAYTHLNIDYSKYTILNYSFFGVAVDGSLHGGDFRNKMIYQQGQVQQPAPLLHGGVYDSWDMHLVFGELEYKHDFSDPRVQAEGFVPDGAGWRNVNTGLTGPMPVPLKKIGGAKGIIDLAHEKNVKVMASIGGWSMCKHFREMAADATKRARFINDCKRLMALGFDGIDLDWEYPGPYAGMNFTGSQADFANFTNLVREIRNAIGPNKLITAAFSAAPAKLQGFQWGTLASLMNYFNMMTYDFNGGFSSIAGHNAPLYDYPGAEHQNFSWDACYRALVSLGVPASKINMGAPFYGRGVVTSGAAALNAPTSKTSRTVDPDGPVSSASDFSNWSAHEGTPYYDYILKNKSGWTEHWDDNAKVPYLTKSNYFLSYDNEQSIGLKAQYVVDKGLAGVIVWTVFGDLEISGSTTDYGTKLKRYASVKSPLVNKINEVFAQGSTGIPVVNITSPANGASVNAGSNVAVTATASDAGGSISRVEFFLDGNRLGEDTSSPYAFTIPSIASGAHTIMARATDNSGNTASSSISVNAGSNNDPVVSITSPSTGSTFSAGANITIAATASDNGGSISKVEFYQGTSKLGEDNTSPYAYTWTSVPAGSYQLTARATDNSGNTTVSSTVAVTVTGAECSAPAWNSGTQYNSGAEVSRQGSKYQARWWTQGEDPVLKSGPDDVWRLTGSCDGSTGSKPTSVITGPSTGATFTSPSCISITATASDADGTVSKVEFFQGSTKLGEDTSAPYSFNWCNVPAGSYTLTARAIDNSGQSTTSAAVTVTMKSSTGTDDCSALPQYAENGGYTAGSKVKNGGSRYECKPYPYSGWCNGAAWAYAPGTGTYWQDAWTQIGSCTSTTSATSMTIRAAAVNATSFKVVGYMPSWSGSASDIQYSKVTHINYAFIRPTTTGGLTAVDQPQKLQSIVSMAHSNGVLVGIAVGGWSDLNNADFQSMAANPSYRTNFINNLLSLINTYQLDGVDMDWEYPADGSDPQNFSTLMSELGSALHARGKFLTAAVAAQGYYANGVLSSVFPSVDFLNIMVYDGGNGADHSPYSYAISSLDYWRNRGLPAEKTVLGVPFYARPSWKSFRQLVAEGANPNSDTYNGDYYNGIATIKQKTNLAFDRGLGGIMIWELSQDAVGSNSLLSSIQQVVDERSGSGPQQSPYGGTARSIPGVIEAEHYDLGGGGIAYNDNSTGNSGGALRTDNVDIEATTDTGGGHNVGWIQAGEWLEYTINVNTAGTYTVSLRVAATSAGRTFHLELDGANITGTITVPNTGGWQNWQTVTATTPSLTTGQKILRVVMDGSDFNLNKMTFSTSGGNPSPSVSITAPANNSSFVSPSSITITANASDNGSVTRVEFFRNGVKLGEDTSAPYAYAWSSPASGSHQLTARATDNQGAQATSSVVNVTVSTSNTGCGGVPQYVENGGYVAGSIVQNSGSQYECKPYPYSGWCNGAAWAYAPGSGAYWQDAWVLKGTCTSSLSRSSEGDFLTEGESGLSVYPNPAEGKATHVTLGFETPPGKISMTLSNVNGSAISFEEADVRESNTVQMPVPSLSPGLYIIHVRGSKAAWKRKYLVK